MRLARFIDERDNVIYINPDSVVFIDDAHHTKASVLIGAETHVVCLSEYEPYVKGSVDEVAQKLQFQNTVTFGAKEAGS